MFSFRTGLALAIIPALCLILAAAPSGTEKTAEELIQAANDAFAHKDYPAAERFYEAAELVTTDPGLVAFNRATALFHSAAPSSSDAPSYPERYGEAARYYSLVLNDAACPPERAAKAWYNRGTCLLRHPGETAAVYRSAIACFEHCLDSDAADAALKADAARNLKIAKLLWNEARAREKKEDNPNRDLPPEELRGEPPPKSQGSDTQPGTFEPGEGNTGAEVPKVVPQPAAGPGMKASPTQSENPSTGSSGDVLRPENSDRFQSFNPEETRELLRRAAKRLKDEQRNMRRTLYGAERTGVHDW